MNRLSALGTENGSPKFKPEIIQLQMYSFARQFAIVLILLLPVAAQPPGEQPSGPDQPTFSTDVKVVNILATVRTKSGQIIDDLTSL